MTSWSDAPRPCSWAARPRDIAGAVRITEASPRSSAPPWTEELARAQRVRCHPDLLTMRPLAGVPIVLRGFTPDGVLGFYVPPAGVTLDLELDTKRAERALDLRRLVLLPDERRAAATFETKFRFEARDDRVRSARVRLTGEA